VTAARYRDPNATWLGSPNFSPNRDGHDLVSEPRYIVMHTMVGIWQGANGRFQQPAQASAHYGVKLDGGLVQWVDEGDAAWHAGNYEVNLDSIGIEHEDGGNYNAPRPDVLKQRSAELLAAISQRYTLPLDRTHVKLHKEVSLSPTACPDALEVQEIIDRANLILNPPPPPAPEWKVNLKPNAQHFDLSKAVWLRSMDSGAQVKPLGPGPLDVAFETTVKGVKYWLTQYAVDHGTGDGILQSEVTAAVTPPDPCAAVNAALAASKADWQAAWRVSVQLEQDFATLNAIIHRNTGG
jgi:N-acetylmuramoyl-L-alanine amidase